MPERSPAPVVKVSQRPSKSCTECIRRKTRCDKRVPCDQCTRRGVAQECRLESQYRPIELHNQHRADGAVTVSAEWARRLSTELAELRARVAGIESRELQGLKGTHSPKQDDDVHRTRQQTVSGGVTGIPYGAVVTQVSSRVGSAAGTDDGSGDGPDDHVEDAATTLEYFALGLDRRLGGSQTTTHRHGRLHTPRHLRRQPDLLQRSHILSDPTYHGTPDSVREALLPRQNVARILSFAETDVQWQHCCVFFPYLWREMDGFWEVMESDLNEVERWAKMEPTWIALLYSIMGVAIHQMSDSDAEQCGLAPADRLVLPNALISAAEDALTHGSFLSNPSMWTVQTIAILTLCGHNVCESDLLSSLLAVGIRMAQGYGLHSLGRRASEIESQVARGLPTDPEDVIQLELGKRIFWSLCQEDYFSIPFCGVWTIQPDHFDTPLPLSCSDSELAAGVYRTDRPLELSVAFKQRFSSQMALIVRDVFDQLRRLSSGNAVDVVAAAVARINALLHGLPEPLSKDRRTTPSTSSAPYAAAMRHYIHVSANHKLLIVHRALLAHGTTRHHQSRAQKACLRYAQAIIEEIEQGQRSAIKMQAFWTIPYHGLAAAVVLVLDLIGICRQGLETSALARSRRQEVLRARATLESLSPTSRIARRGLRVISDLLRQADLTARGKKRDSDGEILSIVRGIQVPANEIFDGSEDEVDDAADATVDASATDAADTTHFALAMPVPSLIRDGNNAANEDHTFTTHAFGQSTISPEPSWINDFTLTQAETDELLASLQASIPDVGRLFDGSIGSFI